MRRRTRTRTRSRTTKNNKKYEEPQQGRRRTIREERERETERETEAQRVKRNPNYAQARNKYIYMSHKVKENTRRAHSYGRTSCASHPPCRK